MNTETCLNVYSKPVRRSITLVDLLYSKLFRQRVAGIVLILVGLITLKLDGNLTILITLSIFYLPALLSNEYIFYD